MNSPSRNFPWTVLIGLLLLVLAIAMAILVAEMKSRVAHKVELPALGAVADFTLTNENGTAVSLADLRGHVWIGDIIFTRCPGPCLRMTRQMKELQDALPAQSNARLVSLTTDPTYDSPEILKRYGERMGADFKRWTFLTGTPKEIGHLAIDSLKLTAVEKKPEERESADDLWVHSTIFVVVGKHGQLRGVYETTGEGVDWTQSKREILSAVKQLEREP